MYERTTPPTLQAIPTTDLQLVLGLDSACDYQLLSKYIIEATDFVEMHYRVSVMQQSWTLTADSWADERCWRPGSDHGYIALEWSPVTSVTSVTYEDGNQNSQTWDNYRLVLGRKRSKLMPYLVDSWPAVSGAVGCVSIEYQCGYTSQSDVPLGVQRTIRDVAQHRYEHECLPTDDWMRALDIQMVGYAARVYA